MTFSILLICVVVFFFSIKGLRERVQELQRELHEVKKDLLNLKANIASLKVTTPLTEVSAEKPASASSIASASQVLSEKPTANVAVDAGGSQGASGKARSSRVYTVESSGSLRDFFGGLSRSLFGKSSFFQSQFAKNIEQQFAGNLTGLLGTLAVVLGVIFLGVYAGIQLDAIGRFGVVCGFSSAFVGLYFFLSRKSIWKNLSLWARSASGVIFLMGCLGSVGVPAMRWVYDPLLSLGVLSIGLLVHMVFGFLNGGQAFASVHVLLSLFALAILPFSTPIFAIATVVTVMGVLFSFRNPNWSRHLLVTSVGFFVLHVYWMSKDGIEHGRSVVSPFWGILFSLCVGVIGLAHHYYHLYGSVKNVGRKNQDDLGLMVDDERLKQTETKAVTTGASHLRWPLISHLAVWLTMGVNLFLHSEGSPWSSLFLALASILSFGMSVVTRGWLTQSLHKGTSSVQNSIEQMIGGTSMGWLFVCDRLVSLALALLAIVSLKKFGFSGFELVLFASIASTLFLRLAAQTVERWVFVVANLVSLLAHLSGLLSIFWMGPQTSVFGALSLLFCSYLVLVFVFPFVDRQAQRHRLGLNQVSLFSSTTSTQGFLSKWSELAVTGHEVVLGLYSFIALILVVANDWQNESDQMQNLWLLVPAAIFANNLYVKTKFKNLVLDWSALIFSSLTVFYSVGVCVLSGFSLPKHFSFVLCVGLLGLSCLGYRFRFLTGLKRSVTWPVVGWFWLILMTMSFQFTKQISPIIPGVLWLLLSVVACELKDLEFFNKNSKEENSAEPTGLFLGFAGVASLLAFVLRFVLVDMANNVLVLETLRLRTFSEVLCLGVATYWLLYGRYPQQDAKKDSTLGVETSSPVELATGAASEAQPRILLSRSTQWFGYFADHFLELLLSLLVLFVSAEFNSIYYPVVWSLCSLGCFGFARKTSLARLSLYAYVFYVLALFNIAFSSTTIATPSSLLLDQAWVFGLLSVGICTALMVVQRRYKKSPELTDLRLPYLVRWVNRIWILRNQYEVRALLYPLFISIACFLFWSFDKSVLSLLWVVECFVLFLISLLMREPQFRVVSMVGIAGVCIRILVYDLTGQDFLVKALVFISVGLILIAMNTIYNRYKHRFEAEAGLK